MKELITFRKYLNEGRLLNENLKVGDKGTIEVEDEDVKVIVTQNPKGKEATKEDFKDGIVWVEFLEGQFEGEISSYLKDAIEWDNKSKMGEGVINEEFSSRGYQISTVDPEHLELGDGFQPLTFADFDDEVDSNNLDSVKDFIQDSIYSTFSYNIDEIYEEIEKSTKPNFAPIDLVKIQIERNGGVFSVTDPITDEVKISGEFDIF